MDKRKVNLLKKMLKGLTPRKNFHADLTDTSYPHCVIGEQRRYTKVYNLFNLFTPREVWACSGGSQYGLTHKKALGMIKSAIKRWSK